MAPISEQIQEVITFREKNRGSKFFNHLSAVSESIQALGWVALVRAKGGAGAGSYSCKGSRLPTASFSTGCKARPLCERDDRCCHVLHKPSPQGVQRCVSLAFARGGSTSAAGSCGVLPCWFFHFRAVLWEARWTLAHRKHICRQGLFLLPFLFRPEWQTRFSF